jgi:hypothetical protein
MDIVNADQAVGTNRGAAALCGTTHKTVKRVLDRHQRGQIRRRAPRDPLTAPVASLIADRVRKSDGRISAKRLLPVAQTAGSLRTFQRAVRRAKEEWKRDRRTYRPWIPMPGEHLVSDWASEGGWEICCAVLAWSRWPGAATASSGSSSGSVETQYRGLADNTGGKVIDTLLRNDAVIRDEWGFAPLDERGTPLLFRFVAAAYERRSLGVASHWPFDQWGRFLPQQSTAEHGRARQSTAEHGRARRPRGWTGCGTMR